MNILISGGNSFISKSIYQKLLLNYNVCAPFHKDVNFTNLDQVKNLLNGCFFNFLIHTAVKEGRRTDQDNSNSFFENMIMLENLLYFQNNYNKLIVFSSGAEFNKKNNIFNRKELENSSISTDFYGLSKYIQTKRVRNDDKVINLRLFNIFGEHGMFDSFIYTSIKNYIEKKPIEIWENKFFDFFSVNDLYIVIDYLIRNPPEKYFELNCVYSKKYLMSEVAEIINNLDNYKVPVTISKELDEKTKHYCGNGDKLKEMNLNLVGLEQEIKNLYQIIKQKYEYFTKTM